jgi:hypothetical protein
MDGFWSGFGWGGQQTNLLTPDLTVTRRSQYATSRTMVPITVARRSMYNPGVNLTVVRRGQYSTSSVVTIARRSQYFPHAGLTVGRRAMYRPISIADITIITGGGGSVGGAGQTYLPGAGTYTTTSYQISVNGEPLLGTGSNRYVSGFTISQKRNQPLTWSMTIQDPLGTLSPRASGSYAGLLSTECYSSGSVIGFGIPVPWAATLPVIPNGILPDPPVLNSVITTTVTITANISIGGSTVTYTWPNLVITNTDYRNDGENGRAVTVSGTDVVGRYLSFRDLTLPTVISTDSQMYMASTVISTILNLLGITSYKFAFDDFPVRTLHILNEKAIDIINKLFFINGAIWYSGQGTSFLTRQPNLGQNGADWVYTDSQNIFVLNEKETALDLINRVTVGFPVEGAFGVGDSGPRKGYGRFDVSINPPITGPPNPVVIQQGIGTFTSYDAFDVNGAWVGHFNFQPGPAPPSAVQGLTMITEGIPPQLNTGGISPGNAKVAKVEFNYIPTGPILFEVNTTATGSSTTSGIVGNGIVPLFIYNSPEPAWHIKFTGRSGNLQVLSATSSVPNFGSFILPSSVQDAQETFNTTVVSNNPNLQNNILPANQAGVTVQIAESINKYGLLQPPHPIINDIIPNLYWAWRVAIQILLASGRSKRVITAEVPPNPFMVMGDVINVVDSNSSLNDTFTAEEFGFRAEADADAVTTFAAYKYDAGIS